MKGQVTRGNDQLVSIEARNDLSVLLKAIVELRRRIDRSPKTSEESRQFNKGITSRGSEPPL